MRPLTTGVWLGLRRHGCEPSRKNQHPNLKRPGGGEVCK